MAKAPINANTGGQWLYQDGKWNYVRAGDPENLQAGYTNTPTGGYAPLSDVMTGATGFKTDAKGINQPLGGGHPVAKDYSQATRIAARPDLIQSKLPSQLSVGARPARVQQMTNQAPTSNPTANALRAIEGNSNR